MKNNCHHNPPTSFNMVWVWVDIDTKPRKHWNQPLRAPCNVLNRHGDGQQLCRRWCFHDIEKLVFCGQVLYVCWVYMQSLPRQIHCHRRTNHETYGQLLSSDFRQRCRVWSRARRWLQLVGCAALLMDASNFGGPDRVGESRVEPRRSLRKARAS